GGRSPDDGRVRWVCRTPCAERARRPASGFRLLAFGLLGVVLAIGNEALPMGSSRAAHDLESSVAPLKASSANSPPQANSRSPKAKSPRTADRGPRTADYRTSGQDFVSAFMLPS